MNATQYSKEHILSQLLDDPEFYVLLWLAYSIQIRCARSLEYDALSRHRVCLYYENHPSSCVYVSMYCHTHVAAQKSYVHHLGSIKVRVHNRGYFEQKAAQRHVCGMRSDLETTLII